MAVGSIVSALNIYSGGPFLRTQAARWAERTGREGGERWAKTGGVWFVGGNGKPVRRTSGTSSRGNPAYLLHGTGKHVGMKEVWLPFRKTRHTEAE